MTVEDEFSQAAQATVGDDGTLTVNGETIVVGAEVTRSIPTADLAFTVTTIRRGLGGMHVEYAPRPTLPGITVEGVLTEMFGAVSGALLVEAVSSLELGDVDGVRPFEVRCAGRLPRQ